MKQLSITILLLMVAGGAAFGAETYDSPRFEPLRPSLMAQGNSATAVAHGYDALFTNPAGFSRKGGDFTLLSVSPASYFLPSSGTLNDLETVAEANDKSAALENLSDIITGNGIGMGLNGGIGFVGNGLGLALVGNTDFYGRGETVTGTVIDGTYTWSAIGGYSMPFHLGGMTLHLGGDVRYMLRTEFRDVSLIDFTEVMGDSATDESIDYYKGDGIAFDLGAILEAGPFTVGASLRDLFGTVMAYEKVTGVSNPDDVFGFEGSGTPVSDLGEKYVIPMSLNLGAAWHPDLGALSFLADPTIHVDWQHPFYAESRKPSIFTELHAGAEIRVLRFIKLRAGINQGYLTAGAGVKLLFLDLNAAYFTREMGNYAGSKPNQGVAVEAAIRF